MPLPNNKINRDIFYMLNDKRITERNLYTNYRRIISSAFKMTLGDSRGPQVKACKNFTKNHPPR